MFLMNRKIGTVIILNLLNLIDLALTLIATQVPHIDFIRAELNVHFVNAYVELLAGNWIPIVLLSLIKVLMILIITIVLSRYERCFLIALFFGIVFSAYSVVSITWILVIVKAQLPSPVVIDCMLVLLFVVSFFIYYSPSELKERFQKTTG